MASRFLMQLGAFSKVLGASGFALAQTARPDTAILIVSKLSGDVIDIQYGSAAPDTPLDAYQETTL